MNEQRLLRRGSSWTLAAAVALVSGLGLSVADSPAQSAPASGTAGYVREHPAMRRMVAERIARVPLLRLRTTASPTARDFELTALALEIALRLDPSNENFARRAVEAWHGAGDTARSMEATRTVARLDPSDTVAQLRLISDRISRLQSVEGRLSAFEKVVGPDGDTIDAAVRSRLALDAALLAREIGDDARFVRLLTRSTQLDASNKDAAALAAAYFYERSEDPMGRVEMLLNVLLADPVDPSAHPNLPRELRSHGAFVSAQRFQDNAAAIFGRAGMPPSLDQQVDSLVGLWQAFGADPVLEALSGAELQMRQARAYEIAVAQAQGRDPGMPLEETRMPPELEAVRMAINLSLGRQGAAEASVRSVGASGQLLLSMLAGAEGQGLDPEMIADGRRRLRSELTWLRLWCGTQIDEAEADLQRLTDEGLINEAATQRYRGLIAFRRGDLSGARTLLEPLGDLDPRSRLGLGMLAEREGETDEALRHYAKLALEQPHALLGAFARRRIELITGTTLSPTPTAAALESYMARTPRWLDEMALDPRSWMHLSVQPVRERVGPMSPLEMDVTVRNIGRMPLAMGPGKPIDTRVLLAPTLLVDGQFQAPNLQVEIADMERRLRLMPGESMTARVWAGQGWLGQALDGLSDRSLTMRWRAVQGYRMDNTGKYLGGSMGLTAEVPVISQSGVAALGQTGDAISRAFLDAQGETLIDAIFYVRSALQRGKEDPNNPDSRAIVAALDRAVAERMASMTELERTLAVLVVGAAFLRSEQAQLDALAASDGSPLVRFAYLIARVPDPESAVYDSFPDAPDTAEMARFAAILRAGLLAAAEAGEVSPLQQDLAPATIVK
ncbi:MAG: hypothetical protein IBJ10_00160 [Phycisphaerales bacterium]|nr:hypothetical protein [Phycisphaerales bacterium]